MFVIPLILFDLDVGIQFAIGHERTRSNIAEPSPATGRSTDSPVPTRRPREQPCVLPRGVCFLGCAVPTNQTADKPRFRCQYTMDKCNDGKDGTSSTRGHECGSCSDGIWQQFAVYTRSLCRIGIDQNQH